MTRDFPRVDVQIFEGWTDKQIAEYAAERIAHYRQPGGVLTNGEKALLIDAWEYAIRKSKERHRAGRRSKAA